MFELYLASIRVRFGANHRSRLARMDTAKAVKATAHQLARLIYAMLTKGQHRQHHNTWSVTRDRLYRCALQEAASYCCRVHVLFAVTAHF